MMAWAKQHPLPLAFLLSVIAGLALVSAAAFTISVTLGLLVSGAAVLAGGHWLTYLHVNAGGAR